MGGCRKTVTSCKKAEPKKPFNCNDQSNPTWQERAERCAELVASLDCASEAFALADIGCGDQKLRQAIQRRGLTCCYQGYDLLPQHGDVVRFDLRSDTLPRQYDVAALLGVVEYLDGVEQVVASLASQVPWVLLSHVIRQDGYYTDARRSELGWRNHFTKDEIFRMLEVNGLTVVHCDMTSDNRTLLMACRSQRFARKV